MRKSSWIGVVAAWCLLAAGSPARAQSGCGTPFDFWTTCCDDAVNVTGCRRGTSNCYLLFPGVWCGGTCYAATATTEFGCSTSIAAASANNGHTRAALVQVRTCGGDDVTMIVDMPIGAAAGL